MTAHRISSSPGVRRLLASLAVVAFLAATTCAALVATRYVAWNWASGLLAAATTVAAILGIGRALDRLEAWVERGGDRGGA